MTGERSLWNRAVFFTYLTPLYQMLTRLGFFVTIHDMLYTYYDIINKDANSVVPAIRKFIREKDLRPGDRLPTHAQLTQALGVGPRRLREGLSILEQQGLLVTRGRGGTVVADPPIAALNDPIQWHLQNLGCGREHLVEARAAMESEAAGQAATKRTARELLVLLDAIEQMEGLTRSGKSDEAVDERFHLAILQATHNPVMLIFGQLISAQFQRKPEDRLTSSLKRQKESIKEHQGIFDAIEKRDAGSAAKLMKEHILKQLSVYQKEGNHVGR